MFYPPFKEEKSKQNGNDASSAEIKSYCLLVFVLEAFFHSTVS